MSKEILPCPYCGETPDTSLIDDIIHYACQTLDCICEDMWATIEEWTRRFVCLDKNGKKVFAGDKVNTASCKNATANRAGGIVVESEMGHLYDVWPSEIELIESDGE